MPELPQKKVGIIACSGEEMAEGSISRQAALKVLEQLCPGDTVTICLPLFLAGGEGDRAFARFYPTIAVDGCGKRCAYRGTQQYSNTPAASIVISDLIAENGLEQPICRRKLDEAGLAVVDLAAEKIAEQVGSLLGKPWSRRAGAFQPSEAEENVATCSCGSGIPIQKVLVDGSEMTLIALPAIFENFWSANKLPSDATAGEIMDMVKIYNGIDPALENGVLEAVSREYQAYCRKQEQK